MRMTLRPAGSRDRDDPPEDEREDLSQFSGGHRIPGTLIGFPLSKAVR